MNEQIKPDAGGLANAGIPADVVSDVVSKKATNKVRNLFGFLLVALLVAGSVYYYGFYELDRDDQPPTLGEPGENVQGLMVDKATKFFKFEYADVLNWVPTSQEYRDVEGKTISYFWFEKATSMKELLESTYPVYKGKILYGDYKAGAVPKGDTEHPYYVFPTGPWPGSTHEVSTDNADEHIIPAYKGFAIISYKDTRIFDDDIRSEFDEVPRTGNAADLVSQFTYPIEEEDWVMLPINDKETLKVVMNSQAHMKYADGLIAADPDGYSMAYLASLTLRDCVKYVWYQDDQNYFKKFDLENLDFTDASSYSEIGEGDYKMMWLKMKKPAGKPVEDPGNLKGQDDPKDLVPVFPEVQYATPDKDFLKTVTVTFDTPVKCDVAGLTPEKCFAVALDGGGEDGVFVVKSAVPVQVPGGEGAAESLNWTVVVDKNFSYDTLYKVTALETVADAGGEVVNSEHNSATFKIDMLPVPVAPTVTSAEALNQKNINIYFNEPVKCDDVSVKNCFKVTPVGDGAVVEVTSAESFNADGLPAVGYEKSWALVVDPAPGIDFDADYEVQALSKVKNAEGTSIGDPDFAIVNYPEPEPLVKPTMKSATVIDNGPQIKVVFNMSVKCAKAVGKECFSVVYDPANGGELPALMTVTSAVADSGGAGWLVTVAETGVPNFDYIVTAASLESEKGASMGTPDSGKVKWNPVVGYFAPKMTNASVMDNGVKVSVGFDMAVSCTLVSDVDCFGISGGLDEWSGAIHVVVAAMDDLCGDAESCNKWVLTVDEPGNPAAIYTVSANDVVSDKDELINPDHDSWEVKWVGGTGVAPVLATAMATPNVKNEIGLVFDVPIKCNAGLYKDCFAVFADAGAGAEVEVEVVEAKWITAGGLVGGMAWKVTLASNMESDVEYLVVAKSNMDVGEPSDAVNYVAADDEFGTPVNSTKNSKIVSISYEPASLEVKISSSTPPGKVVEKGVVEEYTRVTLSAVNGAVGVTGVTLGLQNEGGNTANFSDFDNVGVWVDGGGGQLVSLGNASLAGALVFLETLKVDFTGVDGGLVIEDGGSEDLYIKLGVSADATSGNKRKLGVTAVSVADEKVNVSGMPVYGNVMEIGKDKATLLVELATNTPPIGHVIQGAKGQHYTYFDLTALDGDVVVSAVDVSRFYTPSAGVGDPSWNPNGEERFDSIQIAELGGANLGDGNFSYVNNLPANVDFYENLTILKGEIKHLVIKADIDIKAFVDSSDALGIKEKDDVYLVQGEYDVTVSGDFPVEGNKQIVDAAPVTTLFVDVEPEYNYVDPPIAVKEGDVFNYFTVSLSAKNGDIDVSGIEFDVVSGNILFKNFTVEVWDGLYMKGGKSMGISSIVLFPASPLHIVNGQTKNLQVKIGLPSDVDGGPEFWLLVADVLHGEGVSVKGDLNISGPKVKVAGGQATVSLNTAYSVDGIEPGQVFDYMSFDVETVNNDVQLTGVNLSIINGGTGNVVADLKNFEYVRLKLLGGGTVGTLYMNAVLPKGSATKLMIPMDNVGGKYTILEDAKKTFVVELKASNDMVQNETTTLKLANTSDVYTNGSSVVFGAGNIPIIGNAVTPVKTTLSADFLGSSSTEIELSKADSASYMDIRLDALYGEVCVDGFWYKAFYLGVNKPTVFDKFTVSEVSGTGAFVKDLSLYGGTTVVAQPNVISPVAFEKLCIPKGDKRYIKVSISTDSYYDGNPFELSNFTQFGITDFAYFTGYGDVVTDLEVNPLWGPMIKLVN